MKKVISIVLALLMLIPVAAMLVPTASAATAATPAVGPADPTAYWVYYEEDFDDVDPTLVDKDLAAAIGWAAPGGDSTLLIQDGQLRGVNHYYPGGNRTPTANKWATEYATTIVAQDSRMVTSTTVIEYDMTYQRRAKNEANDIKVSDTKTIMADGQGTYQFAGSVFRGSDKGYIIGRINLTGAVQAGTHSMDFTPKDGARTWSSIQQLRAVNAMPTAETTTTGIEYHNNPVDTNEGKYTSTVIGLKMHVKQVIDPLSGIEMLYVNDQLVAYSTQGIQGNMSSWAQSLTSAGVEMWFKQGIDVLFDNIKVWGYNSAPNLVVSEVATNGQGTTSTEGGNRSVYTGDYQWVELYNPTNQPVNVYDYSLVLDTAAFDSATATIGMEAELGANAWQTKDKYSSIGYFRSGKQNFTMADGTATAFTNPTYANGVLQPGETAMVLLPSTGLKANMAVDNETIKAYFTDRGMPANTKIFVVDNKSDKKFEMTLDQSNVLGIMAVTGADTDDVQAIGYGKSVYDHWYYESYTIVTAKSTPNGTSVFGFYTKNGNEFPVNKDGSLTMGASLTTPNASFEISYFDWGKVEGSATKMGFMRYNSTVARKGIDGTDVKMTPGYVPVECRAPINVTYTDATGNATTTLERLGTEFTVKTPSKKGYDTRVLVNGKVVAENANDETYTIPASEMSRYNTAVSVEYFREAPIFVGFQVAEEAETYSLRLLAAVNDDGRFLDNETNTLGFDIYMAGSFGDKSVIYNVGYVYDAVTVDGETVTPQDLGYDFDYFYAVHIVNIPKDVFEADDFVVYAKAVATVDGVAIEDTIDNMFPVVE